MYAKNFNDMSDDTNLNTQKSAGDTINSLNVTTYDFASSFVC